MAMVDRGRRAGSRSTLEGVLSPLRRRALRQVPQRDPRMDHASREAPRAGGPVDVAAARGLRSAPSCQERRRGSQATLGGTATTQEANPNAGLEGFRDTPAPHRHAGEGAETQRKIAGETERQPLGACQALPDPQEGRVDRYPPRSSRSLQLNKQLLRAFRS